MIERALYRAARPGMADTVGRLDALHARAVAFAAEAASEARRAARSLASWRGGIDGRAINPDGDTDPAITEKLRAELRYWVGVVRGTDPGFPGTFIETFSLYQRHRLGELGFALGMDDVEQLVSWASTASAVEIGGGPLPSVGMLRWRRAVAVDPLADGYAAERLVPAFASHVTQLGAPGERIPLASAAWDLAVCENCLDHVEDPGAVLAEIARLLRPGGYLWFLVDFMEFRDALHPNPMNEERLRSLLRAEGLEPLFEADYECVSHPCATAQRRALLWKPAGERPAGARGFPGRVRGDLTRMRGVG